MALNKDIEFLDELIRSLKEVRGVVGIVLGGSRAKGTHHAGSDFDLGLYYDSGSAPDLNQLCQVARRFDDRRQDNLLTSFGEWGPWINGGGWLKIKSIQVDILYRDLVVVKSIFQDCLKGQISICYQPGHPHGFVSSIYFAEIAHCQILRDDTGVIANLKSGTSPFPHALKQGIIQKFLWEADFALVGARKGIPYQDISYISGSFYRVVSCLNQVLFALNEQYWMNEKGSVKSVSSFPVCPEKFEKRINEVFSKMWVGRKYLNQSAKLLSTLVEETTELVIKQAV